MCYAWFYLDYNYFNVVIDEKSAFNNARDCFKFCSSSGINIMETGIRIKDFRFLSKIETVFSVGGA